MKFQQIGRKLYLEFGDSDDKVEIIVPPASSKTGREITSLWLEVTFPALTEVKSIEALEASAERLVELAVGAENVDKLEQLRVTEQAEALAAAVVWNGIEGGDDLLQVLVDRGYAAARQEYATRLGFGEAFTAAMNQALGRAATDRAEQIADDGTEAA
jgi:hypothetical protein